LQIHGIIAKITEILIVAFRAASKNTSLISHSTCELQYLNYIGNCETRDARLQS
jgi:hypothetical protein